MICYDILQTGVVHTVNMTGLVLGEQLMYLRKSYNLPKILYEYDQNGSGAFNGISPSCKLFYKTMQAMCTQLIK